MYISITPFASWIFYGIFLFRLEILKKFIRDISFVIYICIVLLLIQTLVIFFKFEMK